MYYIPYLLILRTGSYGKLAYGKLPYSELSYGELAYGKLENGKTTPYLYDKVCQMLQPKKNLQT